MAPHLHAIAPSGPIAPDDLAAGLAVAGELALPVFAPEDLCEGASAYLAGSDAARAERLTRALRALPSGVWMARGGYGAIRTLRALGDRLHALPRTPLWGCSDGTVLLARWASLGWPAWHAPPLSQLPRLDAPSRERLVRAMGEGVASPLDDLVPITAGRARGPLVGGNLCVLASLVGTPHAADLRGGVLLLEDVGEPAYRVDRLMTQLRYAGALDGIVGLVFGDFTRIDDAQRALIASAFDGLAADLGVPAARGAPIGHGARNAAVPLGVGAGLRAALDVGPGSATLAFEPVTFGGEA